ncbi:EcsC family protein [Bacillus sp. CGMCC 1.16541]|uniref:EcsC family protein n=1 Tax=Bacillus sp. CGMCC 1.16541 TaxID=2185143 RepID=UPI000D73AE0B|nr:EcsC family protein [Bacillus sp. CGMCC 1.16541]
MELTSREQQLFNEIEQWEQSLQQYEATELQVTYEQWLDRSISFIPEDILDTYLRKVDDWVFHLNGIIQGTQVHTNSKKQILETARVFDEDIKHLHEIKELHIDQLSYICEQQLAKQRLYSLTQGALSGTGNVLFLGADIPALLVLNLHAVQVTAMSYGYEVNTPFEMLLALKVFHAATLPKRWQHQGWEYVKEEVQQEYDLFFYEGNERVVDKTWLEKVCTQLLKATLILATKRKAYDRLPIISMAIGGGLNYRFTREVTDFSKRFYQYRSLMDKSNMNNR